MALFSVTTLVVFHFALQRGQVEGDLAAGVLWVTLLFAAMLGISRLFVADHEEGGLDGFLLAPVDRTALLVAKALALLGFLVALEVVAVPAFALLLLGPDAGAGGARARWSLVLLLADVGHRGRRHAGRRARGPDPRARPDRPAAGAAAAVPVVIARREGDRAALRWRPARRRSQGAGWPILGLYDLVFGLLAYAVFDYLRRGLSRLLAVRNAPPRPLAPDRRHRSRRASALAFFYAPMDADQGFMQKIFYVHVPLAIVALCGFVFGGDHGHPAPAHAATARYDLRSYVAIHLSLDPRRRRADHRLDLGQGGVGPLVGVGRADARLLPRSSSCSTRPTSRCASRSRTPSARRATRACSRSSPAPSCR